MNNKFKALKFIPVMVLILSLLLSGCGASGIGTGKTEADTQAATTTAAVTENPTAEHVKLKMFVLGDEKEDDKKVLAEISKKLTEKINAELELGYIGWGDWDKQYPLKFSSGEDFDMIFTSGWAFYPQTASKGGFYELTEEIRNKYCPLAMANLPAEAWKSTAISGKNYMIPFNAFFADNAGIAIRGDLREKYGIPEIKTVADLDPYMDAVLKNEKGMIPLDISVDTAWTLVKNFVLYPAEYGSLASERISPLCYKYTDPKVLDLKPYYEISGYLDHIKRMRDWNQKGYISQSDLIAADHQQRFEAGKSAVKVDEISQIDIIYQKAKKDHPDWKIEYVNVLEGKKLGSQGFSGNGCAFNARSKNVERAIMAADLLDYDPELNFLIKHGIPGVHNSIAGKIEKDGKEFLQINPIEPDKYGGFSWWCFSNVPEFPVESFPGYADISISYFYKQKVNHPLDGISFVTDAVNTEIANVSQVQSKYASILNMGFDKNPEKLLNEYIEKLKEAGIDKINNELTAQAKAVFDAAQ